MAKRISRKTLLATVLLILFIHITVESSVASRTGINQDSKQTQKRTYLIPSISKQNKPIALMVVDGDDD